MLSWREIQTALSTLMERGAISLRALGKGRIWGPTNPGIMYILTTIYPTDYYLRTLQIFVRVCWDMAGCRYSTSRFGLRHSCVKAQFAPPPPSVCRRLLTGDVKLAVIRPSSPVHEPDLMGPHNEEDTPSLFHTRLQGISPQISHPVESVQ